jgi:hypothetical protein
MTYSLQVNKSKYESYEKLRDHLEDLRVDGRIILKWVFNKWDGEAMTGLLGLRIDRDTRRALVNAVTNRRAP